MNDELNFDIKVSISEIEEKTGIPFAKSNADNVRTTMKTNNKTCAQLVYQKMMECNEQLDEMETILSDIESTEEMIAEAEEGMQTFALGHDVRRTVKIQLSTGGPADWIEVILDVDDDYIYGMNYHYADWFDHAETVIEKNSYLWDYAARYIENYL